jgi:integrase
VKGETTVAQQGYVFKEKGSWYLRYRDNFNVDGKIVRKQKCVQLAEVGGAYRRKSDLSDLVREKLDAVCAAEKTPRSSDSFVTYVEGTYLPFVKRTMKPSTHRAYETYWRRYLKPRVGKYSLRDFTVATVAGLLKDITSMHTLNTDTVGKIRSILSGIFSYAISEGHFPARSKMDNPACGARIPEKATEPKPTVAASRDEVKAILARLKDEGLMLARAAVALLAFTGIRPGECRGLQWQDWDQVAEQLHIVRSVWHTHETEPKTEKSIRYVAVTPELRSILLDLWESQGSPTDGYLLARANGRKKNGRCKRVNLDNESKRVIMPALTRCAVCHESESAKHEGHDFVRDESLPRWFGFYSLRRFHATAVRGKSDLKTTAKALGNSEAIAEKHYVKDTGVLPGVRVAVIAGTQGLVN